MPPAFQAEIKGENYASLDNLDGNLEEDIEEPEDGIDNNNIDFALTVQATTIVNQETLDYLLGFRRVTLSDEVRQPSLSYEDPGTKSDSASKEGENSENGSQAEEKELAEPISSDFDLSSVENDESCMGESSDEDFFEAPTSL